MEYIFTLYDQMSFYSLVSAFVDFILICINLHSHWLLKIALMNNYKNKWMNLLVHYVLYSEILQNYHLWLIGRMITYGFILSHFQVSRVSSTLNGLQFHWFLYSIAHGPLFLLSEIFCSIEAIITSCLPPLAFLPIFLNN